MNKFLIITFLLVASSTLYGQNIKIGTNGNAANPDAGLEIDFTDKGLLLPRLNLVETTNSAPLNAHVEGMIIYNDTTSVDVVPGLYVNDGTEWIPLKYTAGSGIDIIDNEISTSGGGGGSGTIDYTLIYTTNGF